MKYDLSKIARIAETNAFKEFQADCDELLDDILFVGIPPGMPGNDFPGLMGSSIAYDEVGAPRLLHRFEYPAAIGLAPDRDRIRAHLRILHSTLMRNYTVTFEQFNNGVKRLSCDELEIPSEICGYRAFGITDTAEAVAEVRKHGYRLNAVGMTRFRRIK